MANFPFFAAPVETYCNVLVNWAPCPARELISYAGIYRGAAMNLVAFREQRGVGDTMTPSNQLQRTALKRIIRRHGRFHG